MTPTYIPAPRPDTTPEPSPATRRALRELGRIRRAKRAAAIAAERRVPVLDPLDALFPNGLPTIRLEELRAGAAA